MNSFFFLLHSFSVVILIQQIAIVLAIMICVAYADHASSYVHFPNLFHGHGHGHDEGHHEEHHEEHHDHHVSKSIDNL